MQQKITWMRFLTIGISIAFFVTLNSCDKGEVEHILTTNFKYKNLTSENVELKLYNQQNENYKNYLIAPNNEVTISTRQVGSETGIGEPFAGVQKIILKFETSNLCLENFPKLKEVKEYDNFSESMYNNSNNTLIYNIDNEELNLATVCN